MKILKGFNFGVYKTLSVDSTLLFAFAARFLPPPRPF